MDNDDCYDYSVCRFYSCDYDDDDDVIKIEC